ncbi:1-phosphofructokinase family hexose kinase [Enterococcus sp. AZ109]|uniref:1-phosphofructokinase family hexose kinase n=1 Tax=Enterococcus sp. AZ109 TaxID=2774634 RepID=UPI003F1EB873
MIITITMNPSMDFAYTIKQFQLGKMNRFKDPVQSVGGKGINAGRTAALSGSTVHLTGFLAGDFGKMVKKELVKENLCSLDMLETTGKTRKAITIMHDDNTHTEIVESGPEISSEEIRTLLGRIGKKCAEETVDLICISGSINSENEHIYLDMLTYIRENISQTIPVFMDVSEQQLASLLKSETYKPTFIKPNHHELSQILDKEIATKEQALKELNSPLFDGIDYIMVSCGKDGAICKVNNDFYDVAIPSIPVINTTGSGDASVGGFVHAVVNQYSIEETLKYSMACGMSNAQHGEVGTINLDRVKEFCSKIQVNKLTFSKA